MVYAVQEHQYAALSRGAWWARSGLLEALILAQGNAGLLIVRYFIELNLSKFEIF